jgi:lipopolysaccharide transport system ATP-binding protein
MSSTMISIDDLGKKYTIRHERLGDQRYRRLSEDLIQGIKRPFHRLTRGSTEKGTVEEFWALRDVSFNIGEGEVVGIIGRNGAGKSTLLKILSRITEPTEGRVRLRGRVASLLEVGTGFHPELTGRENIFLNGSMLGMKRAEIRKKFDEIVDFSGVEQFIDTPVKRYSSGMSVRLGFGVAAYLEPEILIVDEVLAVGDAEFQRKCLGKMQSVASLGRTVLFVSHNMTAVNSLCSRAILLDKGRISFEGTSQSAVSRYLRTAQPEQRKHSWDPESAPRNEQVRLIAVRVVDRRSEPSGEITVNTPIDLEFDFESYPTDIELNLSVSLFNAEGIRVFNTCSPSARHAKQRVCARCRIPGGLLNDSTYRAQVIIVEDTSRPILVVDDAVAFEVHDVERSGNWFGKWPGALRPQLDWTFEPTHGSIS